MANATNLSQALLPCTQSEIADQDGFSGDEMDIEEDCKNDGKHYPLIPQSQNNPEIESPSQIIRNYSGLNFAHEVVENDVE